MARIITLLVLVAFGYTPLSEAGELQIVRAAERPTAAYLTFYRHFNDALNQWRGKSGRRIRGNWGVIVDEEKPFAVVVLIIQEKEGARPVPAAAVNLKPIYEVKEATHRVNAVRELALQAAARTAKVLIQEANANTQPRR